METHSAAARFRSMFNRSSGLRTSKEERTFSKYPALRSSFASFVAYTRVEVLVLQHELEWSAKAAADGFRNLGNGRWPLLKTDFLHHPFVD
jgi:hypothetical protein